MTYKTLIKILEWLFVNNGRYSSAFEWRIAFTEFLKSLVNEDEKSTDNDELNELSYVDQIL